MSIVILVPLAGDDVTIRSPGKRAVCCGMFFIGLGTAVPARRYTQLQCWEGIAASAPFAKLNSRSQALLKKVLTGRNGISTRHLALDPLEEVFEIAPDVLHDRFQKNARALVKQAAENALANAGASAKEIDAIIISTCTGYLCPGLTSYALEDLRLRAETQAFDLVGQGCGAALPNLRMAEGLLAAGRAKKVLSVCVEVCSAAFYMDDDPGVLISACLFGDGAAAAVVSNEPSEGEKRVEWKSCGTFTAPEHRDLLRFEMKNGMLRNILDPCVPILASRYAKNVFDSVCGAAGVDRAGINGWIFHAGGRDVLNTLMEAFELEADAVQESASVLEKNGNISSPFVLFVLKAALDNRRPGGWWWMASFGAGFSSHGALLRVE